MNKQIPSGLYNEATRRQLVLTNIDVASGALCRGLKCTDCILVEDDICFPSDMESKVAKLLELMVKHTIITKGEAMKLTLDRGRQ